MSNVKIVKFMSGQEVIGKVIDESSTRVVVESPLTLQPMRNGETVSLGLMPFSWGGKADAVAFNAAHILCIMDAEDELATQYLAGLSGLSVPQSAPSQSRKLTLV